MPTFCFGLAFFSLSRPSCLCHCIYLLRDVKERATAANMQAFKAAEASINAQYGSSIMTEFPFNGLGILEKVQLLTWR